MIIIVSQWGHIVLQTQTKGSLCRPNFSSFYCIKGTKTNPDAGLNYEIDTGKTEKSKNQRIESSINYILSKIFRQVYKFLPF